MSFSLDVSRFLLYDCAINKEGDFQNEYRQSNKRVDYAIGVNGNSMEPVYHDGDMLLVEMTEEIQNVWEELLINCGQTI